MTPLHPMEADPRLAYLPLVVVEHPDPAATAEFTYRGTATAAPAPPRPIPRGTLAPEVDRALRRPERP